MDVTLRDHGWNVTTLVTATLRRIYYGQPHATKIIARRAAKDPRAVKDWLGGKSSPSSQSLFDLLVSHEELEKEFIQMIQERRALCGH